MNAHSSFWQNIYLRSAGWISAGLGLISSVSFFLSFPQDDPALKWPMLFIGIVGILVSYILGRDVLDRFNYRGLIEDGVPNQQARLALIGTRFTSMLWFFAVGLLLASLFFWLILYVDELNIVGLVCSNPFSIESCAHRLLR